MPTAVRQNFTARAVRGAVGVPDEEAEAMLVGHAWRYEDIVRTGIEVKLLTATAIAFADNAGILRLLESIYPGCDREGNAVIGRCAEVYPTNPKSEPIRKSSKAVLRRRLQGISA